MEDVTPNVEIGDNANYVRQNEESYIKLLTQTRHIISPYLPPPVLHTMKVIDSHPNTKVIGDEPSMTILSALLAILLVGKGIQFLSFLTSGKAVEGLDDDDDAPEGNVLSDLDKLKGSNEGTKNEKRGSNSYKDSVILFGPRSSGKTCLFHTLLSKKKSDGKKKKVPSTVMSLKANASILPKDVGDNNKSEKECIRLVDYPGHVTLSSHLPSLLYPTTTSSSKKNASVRSLLVVDSTKSVSDAALLLYNTVLTNSPLLSAWENENEIFHIMVVCNKADAINAKNWRRIKIQLRSELDKLKKISSSVSSSAADLVNGNSGGSGLEGKRQLTGKSIDLDNLKKNGLSHVKMSFLSCSCLNNTGMEELKAFVMNGDLLLDNSSVLSSRKV